MRFLKLIFLINLVLLLAGIFGVPDAFLIKMVLFVASISLVMSIASYQEMVRLKLERLCVSQGGEGCTSVENCENKTRFSGVSASSEMKKVDFAPADAESVSRLGRLSRFTFLKKGRFNFGKLPNPKSGFGVGGGMRGDLKDGAETPNKKSDLRGEDFYKALADGVGEGVDVGARPITEKKSRDKKPRNTVAVKERAEDYLASIDVDKLMRLKRKM